MAETHEPISERAERIAIETMRITAKMLREFHLALLEQGFNGGEAMYYATEWLRATMQPKR